MELDAFLQNNIYSWFLIFSRIAAAFAVIPCFGERIIPERVKLLIAALLALAIYKTIGVYTVPVQVGDIVLALISEILIGFSIGVVGRMLLSSIAYVGSIVSHTMMFNNSISSAAGADPMPTIGTFLNLAAVTFLFSTDMHIMTIISIKNSYQLFPFGQMPNISILTDNVTDAFIAGFKVGVGMCVPFLLMGLVINTALGAVNRVMPNLPVFFVGTPALIAGGFIMLSATCVGLIENFGQLYIEWFGV